jgi:hypothetical protein
MPEMTRPAARLRPGDDNGVSVGRNHRAESDMHCLKCKGFMMVERHYTLMNRRLYARCLNCGFWIDLADLLRFFHRVLDSSVRGTKIRETYTL